MKTILFVCTGNTCRSSMAEAMLKKMLKERYNHAGDIQVISAGTSASQGQCASKNAIHVMKEKDIDLTEHRSTPLHEGLIRDAHLILTMTGNHKEQVLGMVPGAWEKTYTLNEYATRLGDQGEIQGEIDKLQKIIQKKKIEFFKEYEEEITVLRSQREMYLKNLREVDNKIMELEEKMGKLVENDQREVVYLQDKLSSVDILDPFGQPPWVYRECAKEIEETLKVVMEKILE